MPIELNPNNINISSGSSGRLTERQRQPEQQIEAQNRQRPVFRPANLNVIPSNETLQTQIRSALAERREGRAPDRGAILNLLV